MKKILLTSKKSALVDDEDYKKLNQYNWYASKEKNIYYAKRFVFNSGKRSSERMHRVILGLSLGDGKQVDHIDGDGLNNQKSNLRIATKQQNARNKIHRISGFKSSHFKGVCWHKINKNWTARITVNYKNINLGSFSDEKEAAKAYNLAAIKLFGEFAHPNIFEK